MKKISLTYTFRHHGDNNTKIGTYFLYDLLILVNCFAKQISKKHTYTYLEESYPRGIRCDKSMSSSRNLHNKGSLAPTKTILNFIINLKESENKSVISAKKKYFTT